MKPEEIALQLAHFVAPDQVTELRALHVGQRGRTFAGWYDGEHLRHLAKHALSLSREAAGVYFIPNPVNASLLARRPNDVSNVYKDRPALTRDADILERRFILIDIDPRRHVPDEATGLPPDESGPSHELEMDFAKTLAFEFVKPLLASFGFAAPVVMCSGNGIHMIYRLSEPIPGTMPEIVDPLASLLKVIGERLNCYGATIDAHTYNACRMLKVPGTVVRRGSATPNRPHRTAEIIEVPNDWKSVSAALV